MKPRTQRPCRLLNAYRAARAEEVLAAYRTDDDERPRDVLCDLVADLGHLCDINDMDFEPLVDMALIHWRTEREGVQS